MRGKVFLLEKNGDIYSCVRGQKNKDFYYGNIYKDEVSKILNTARVKIFDRHNRLGFNEECASCKYLSICKTGCPFVKSLYNTNKSYTCLLQQELYKSMKLDIDSNNDESVYKYLSKMHPNIVHNYVPEGSVIKEMKSLEELIREDVHLKYIYDDKSFILSVDKNDYPLSS